MCPLYHYAISGSKGVNWPVLVIDWRIRLVDEPWIGTCWPCSLRYVISTGETWIGLCLLALLPSARSNYELGFALLWLCKVKSSFGFLMSAVYHPPLENWHKVEITVIND
jgi:hypothetical protein